MTEPTYCLGVHGRFLCERATTCAHWQAFQTDRKTDKEPLGKVETLCKQGLLEKWLKA